MLMRLVCINGPKLKFHAKTFKTICFIVVLAFYRTHAPPFLVTFLEQSFLSAPSRPQGSLWHPRGLPWGSLWHASPPIWLPFGSLVAPYGPLWHNFGSLVALLGSLWTPLASLFALLGTLWPPFWRSRALSRLSFGPTSSFQLA